MCAGTLRRADGQRGAAAVEFAIIAPLLFMLVFGIVEFGRVWSEKNVFVGAAREAARYAAVECEPDAGGGGCTDDLIEAKAAEAAVGYGVNGDPNANGVCGGTLDTGDPVVVSWEQDFTIDIPFLPTFDLNDVDITASFRCE